MLKAEWSTSSYEWFNFNIDGFVYDNLGTTTTIGLIHDDSENRW